MADGVMEEGADVTVEKQEAIIGKWVDMRPCPKPCVVLRLLDVVAVVVRVCAMVKGLGRCLPVVLCVCTACGCVTEAIGEGGRAESLGLAAGQEGRGPWGQRLVVPSGGTRHISRAATRRRGED